MNFTKKKNNSLILHFNIIYMIDLKKNYFSNQKSKKQKIKRKILKIL
jgi:hypothetical protein